MMTETRKKCFTWYFYFFLILVINPRLSVLSFTKQQQYVKRESAFPAPVLTFPIETRRDAGRETSFILRRECESQIVLKYVPF